MNRLRIELDDHHGTVALILDAADVPHPVAELAAQAIQAVAALPGAAGEDHARQILLCELTRQYADELAYERVAAQRGLLPL